MGTHHINETKSRSQPREAAIGQLRQDTHIDDVTTVLQSAGIEPARIYYLIGEEGAKALDNSRGFLSVFDDVIEKPLTALKQGHTLVGIFGVERDDSAAIRQTLLDAGVTNIHYFGKWTFS
jgi:hypothetical protein